VSLSRKTKERLTTLVEYVEREVKDDEFDMSSWSNAKTTASPEQVWCGTSACMAGHATNVIPGLWLVQSPPDPDVWLGYDSTWYPAFYSNGRWTAGDETDSLAMAFDITKHEASFLFQSHLYDSRMQTCRRFRSFIERDD